MRGIKSTIMKCTEVKCGVVLVLYFIVNSVFIVVPCVGQEQQGERCHPMYISRRILADIVDCQEDGKSVTCTAATENVTYIVSENRCVQNNYLYEECRSFSLTPSTEPTVKRLAIKFEDEKRVKTFTSEYLLTTASIVSSSNQAYANSSLCHVTSLEVYRGEKQSIPINSNGFFLSENATLEINRSQLAFDFNLYMGELYRMNLSCSSGRLPENGCLFFTVGGKTNLSEPKFNCTVPGTVHKYSTDCPPPMMFLHPNSSIQTNIPEPEPTHSIAVVTHFNSGNESLLLYVLVPVGAIIGLSICLPCVCAMIVLFMTCRRKRTREIERKISAITSTEMERRISRSTASKQTDTNKQKGADDDELHIYATPGAIMNGSNVYGCNCLEDNPAYLKPGAVSEHDATVTAEDMLECNYAIIPERHNAESKYPKLTPKLMPATPQTRSRSRSGLDTINTVNNDFYERSPNVQDQLKDCDAPVMSSRRSKPSQSLRHYTH